MKPVLAIITIAGGLAVSGVVPVPATAGAFGPDIRLLGEPIVVPARWVCDPRGNCVWHGGGGRTFYYGPANWRHCDYRWRTGRHGPYRERICW